VFDENGRPTRMLGATTDITDRQESVSSLRAADRRKDEFLAVLAHELRNPLAALPGALEILGLDRPRDEHPSSLGVARRQVDHLAHLIDDLLDATRISQGKIQLRKQFVSLGEVVDRAMEAVRPQLESRGLSLERPFHVDPVVLEVDPTRIEQVLVNLLLNAIKFSDAGGRIFVSIHREGNVLALSVRDTGVGIDSKLLPKLFEMFTQAEQTLDRSQGGLGIGLALVRTLVELHGGTVSAESEGAGRGSVFTVRLPIASQQRRPSHRSNTSSYQPPVLAKHRRRVLIVEDNLDTARGLARLLCISGHEVFVAHDGEAAITATQTHGPEVIVMDLGLPLINGYDVSRFVRSELGCHHISHDRGIGIRTG
jgi:signal transduction histidine kinase